VLRWGEAREAVHGGRHLRVLTLGTAVAWCAAILLALALPAPAVAIAVVALLPTAAVPAGMLVDAWRVHRRLASLTDELAAVTLDRAAAVSSWGGPPLRPMAARGGGTTPQGLEP
jgi:hypothetical protein